MYCLKNVAMLALPFLIFLVFLFVLPAGGSCSIFPHIVGSYVAVAVFGSGSVVVFDISLPGF